MEPSVFTRDNPVFAAFAFYSGILLLKLFFVQFSTVYYRVFQNVYVHEEDAKFADPTGKKIKVDPNHEECERTRRCHQNDLENIFPFIFLGMLYVTTIPTYSTAVLIFRVFTAARIAHTFIFMVVRKQPYRAIAFAVNLSVNVYLAVSVVLFYCN